MGPLQPAAPAGQEPEGPGCHSDHFPLSLPRHPERQRLQPELFVAAASLNQLFTLLPIRLL